MRACPTLRLENVPACYSAGRGPQRPTDTCNHFADSRRGSAKTATTNLSNRATPCPSPRRALDSTGLCSSTAKLTS
jgi:hypothetical protein